MNRRAVVLACLIMTMTTGGPAAAQWLKIPLPGTPRTSDGKPDLTAPVPRTSDGKPDLSGIWREKIVQREDACRTGCPTR
jgi:hypothetical protein